MGLKIKPGSLPQWDEKYIFGMSLPADRSGAQSLNPFLDTSPYRTPATMLRQKRLGHLSVDESMAIIEESLRDNQGYHILDPNGNAWRLCLPHARYLAKGDAIRNLTTNERYTIKHILDEETGDLLLSGRTPPTSTDRLRLAPENSIRFVHDFPRSFASSHESDNTQEVADKPSPFNDTITHIVVRSEPATLSPTPFVGPRNLKPKHRETVRLSDQDDWLIDIESWSFDSIVRFSCWCKTNKRAVELLNWFESFIFRYKWIFELFGVERIFYWRREEDVQVRRLRTDVTKRTIEYLFRTQRLQFSASPRIKELVLKVSVADSIGTLLEGLTVDDAGILDWPEPSGIVTTVNSS